MDRRPDPPSLAGAPGLADPALDLRVDAGDDAARMRSAWRRTLALLSLALAAAVLLGFAIGQPWPALAAVALGMLAWHYWRLRRVLDGLTGRRHREPARGDGAWDELDRLLHRNQAEMRARRRRLLGMLRAYRAAAAALPDAVVVVDRNRSEERRVGGEDSTG